MFYRLITVTHAAEDLSKITDYLDSVRAEYLQTEGLVSNTIISVDETTSVSVAIYETQAASQANAEQASKIIGGVAAFATAPPTIVEGHPVWEGIA